MVPTLYLMAAIRTAATRSSRARCCEKAVLREESLVRQRGFDFSPNALRTTDPYRATAASCAATRFRVSRCDSSPRARRA
jgi:hypothetical protein